MGLADDLTRISAVAGGLAHDGEQLAGVLAAEPAEDGRVYLCAFEARGRRTWLALDPDGNPVESRASIREAASIAALCEIAEETASGGDLDELRSRLVGLRLTENPPGIEEAEEAVLALQAVIGSPPSVASPARLDAVGAAAKRVERALGGATASPFAEAMKLAMRSVEVLVDDVERNYRLELA